MPHVIVKKHLALPSSDFLTINSISIAIGNTKELDIIVTLHTYKSNQNYLNISFVADNKNLIELLKSKIFIKSFPNVEEVAAYNQLFQMIRLDDITQEEFDDIEDKGVNETNFLSAGTIRHELMHFWDHIGTLWGQKNLVLLFNALNAYANGNIDEYWRIKSLHLQCKADELSTYYTQVFNPFEATYKQPWATQISSGVRFDASGNTNYNLPLLFIRFNKQDGTELARTPICVAALLETNAIYEEYKLKTGAVEQIGNPTIKANEKELLAEEIEAVFYSTDFALYSVGAHLVAQKNNLTDVLDIYNLSSSISTLSLNLTDELIQSIKIKAIFDETWDARFRALSENADRGFAYYRLNENLVDFYGPNQYTLENVLEGSGLPDRNKVEMMVMEEMNFNIRNITKGPFNGIGQLLLNYGIRLYSKRGLDGKKPGFDDWVKVEQPWPYFFFNDTYFDPDTIDLESALDNMLENMGNISIGEHFKVLAHFHDKMNEFSETCGV